MREVHEDGCAHAGVHACEGVAEVVHEAAAVIVGGCFQEVPKMEGVSRREEEEEEEKKRERERGRGRKRK